MAWFTSPDPAKYKIIFIAMMDATEHIKAYVQSDPPDVRHNGMVNTAMSERKALGRVVLSKIHWAWDHLAAHHGWSEVHAPANTSPCTSSNPMRHSTHSMITDHLLAPTSKWQCHLCYWWVQQMMLTLNHSAQLSAAKINKARWISQPFICSYHGWILVDASKWRGVSNHKPSRQY